MNTLSNDGAGSLSSASKALFTFVVLVLLLWSIRPLLQYLLDYTLMSTLWGDLAAGAQLAYFLTTGIIVTTLGLPRQSIALLGGYLFGTTLGGLFALTATLGGCVMAYHLAAYFGSARVQRYMPRLLSPLEEWTRYRVFEKTLMVRLMPVGSNLATNVAAGLVRAPRMQFFSASAIGFLPQTMVFVIGGSSANTSSFWQLTIGSLLFVISLAIGMHSYRGSILTNKN